RDQGARRRRHRRLLGRLHAHQLRRDHLAPRFEAPRMPVPLLVLRSEGSGQGGQRTVAAASAGAAVEDRRWAVGRRQALHSARRLPADVKDRNQGGNLMKTKGCLCSAAAASGFALMLCAGTVLAQQPLPPQPKPDIPPPVPPILQNYKPVTAQRLKQPEDGDWLMYRRTYDSWGYSPLTQITPENAGRLKPVWTLQTGQVEGHQAPPMVINGVMFVATPGNQVLAIDAKTGNLLWRFKRPIPEDILLLHPTSRGVGLLGDKVYFAAADAVLVALDAKTGNEVWNAKVEDYTKGYYMSLAPLVADGKVMVGVSGGE